MQDNNLYKLAKIYTEKLYPKLGKKYLTLQGDLLVLFLDGFKEGMEEAKRIYTEVASK